MGEFEQAVLLAILHLGDNAYGMEIPHPHRGAHRPRRGHRGHVHHPGAALAQGVRVQPRGRAHGRAGRTGQKVLRRRGARPGAAGQGGGVHASDAGRAVGAWKARSASSWRTATPGRSSTTGSAGCRQWPRRPCDRRPTHLLGALRMGARVTGKVGDFTLGTLNVQTGDEPTSSAVSTSRSGRPWIWLRA